VPVLPHPRRGPGQGSKKVPRKRGRGLVVRPAHDWTKDRRASFTDTPLIQIAVGPHGVELFSSRWRTESTQRDPGYRACGRSCSGTS